MQIAPMAAIGARFINSTTTTSMGVTPTPPPGGNGFPSPIGDFVLYGCVTSQNQFPTFALTASTDQMTLDLCAASCPTRFFGVFEDDCYCGEDLNTKTSTKIDLDLCDVPCPANEDEFCGGRLPQALARRQAVDASVALTVYIRVNGDGDITDTVTAPQTTITSTITDHDRTTVTTITTAACPDSTQWHKNKIVCYGDYCAPELPCEVCERHRIVCVDEICHPEVCHADDWNKLVICNGDDCKYQQSGPEKACDEKIVCYGDNCAKEKCIGDECQKKFVCEGESCKHETCTGDDCFTKVVNNKVVPVCNDNCPVPPPPGPMPSPSPAPGPGPSNTIPPTVPTGPVIGGTGKTLPALAITLLGAVAGVAFLL